MDECEPRRPLTSDPHPFPVRIVWPCCDGRAVYLARDATGRLRESTDPAELHDLVRRINRRADRPPEGQDR